MIKKNILILFKINILKSINSGFRAKTFSGTEHVKSTARLIEKKEKGEISPNSEFKWTNESMLIPSLTPRLSKCGIIDISYVLEFEVSFINFLKEFVM